MKEMGKIRFFVILLCLLTACGKRSALDDRQSDLQTIEKIKSEAPESEQISNDESKAYEEYLNSLRYLDEIEAELAKTDTTIEMIDAAVNALEAWDNELNKIYALLTEKLSMEQMEELRVVQRLWIKERDQSADRFSAAFEGGSLYLVIYNDILFQCTKQRTLELIAIYFNQNDDYSFDLSLADGLADPFFSAEINASENEKDANERIIYADILRHRELYSGYYAITKNIPGDPEFRKINFTDTEPYYYAICDINNDGIDELLLGYGLVFDHPQILLNILQYDRKEGSIADVDGERTYRLMDNLIFYESGYYSTQNGVGDLYTECWYIKDREDHYWYGYERGGDFYDSSGQALQLGEYYDMVGDESFLIQWKEVTEENIIEETLK